MSKDQLLKKYPDQKEAIEFFIHAAPNGNLKYVEWEMKVLLARQAMKEEVADVIALFDKFSQRLEKKDIYQYQPHELTSLRNQLFAIHEERQNRRNERQKKVDRLYYSAPEDVACGHKVVYDSETLRCLQITNKAAAIHYGMETEWCIRLKDRSYFEDYDKSNVIFFFLFNKQLDKSSSYYKVAFSYERDINNDIIKLVAWDTKDQQFDSAELAQRYAISSANEERRKMSIDKYPVRIVDENDPIRIINEKEKYKQYMMETQKIFPIMINIAKSYPKSLLARIYSNEVPFDEVAELYEKEQNENIQQALAKWLTKSVDGHLHSKHFHTMLNIAATTQNDDILYDLIKSVSPDILDAVVDNVINRPSSDIVRYVAYNNAISEQSISKIFNMLEANKKIDTSVIDIIVGLVQRDNCPIDKLIQYSNNPSGRVQENVAHNPRTPGHIIDKMMMRDLGDMGDTTRGDAIYYDNRTTALLNNPNISPELLQKVFDTDNDSAWTILKNRAAGPDLIRQIFNYWKQTVFKPGVANNMYCRKFAGNYKTPPDVLEDVYKYLVTPDALEAKKIASMLADNPNVSKQLFEKIKSDYPKEIRWDFRIGPHL